MSKHPLKKVTRTADLCLILSSTTLLMIGFGSFVGARSLYDKQFNNAWTKLEGNVANKYDCNNYDMDTVIISNNVMQITGYHNVGEERKLGAVFYDLIDKENPVRVDAYKPLYDISAGMVEQFRDYSDDRYISILNSAAKFVETEPTVGWYTWVDDDKNMKHKTCTTLIDKKDLVCVKFEDDIMIK